MTDIAYLGFAALASANHSNMVRYTSFNADCDAICEDLTNNRLLNILDTSGIGTTLCDHQKPTRFFATQLFDNQFCVIL